GARPVNLHLDALKKMGAEIKVEEGYVVAKSKRLKGAEILIETVTVTGTENVMMAAALAQGTTVLKNAAREPEIGDLADYLNKMGAKIAGAGTDVIQIEGVEELKPAQHAAIADRIEAATFLMAGAVTGGEVTVGNCPPDYLGEALRLLRETGCEIKILDAHQITLNAPRKLKSVNLTTAPFPGLATDLQAQFMALMTLADGISTIVETIFENRFQHALELNRLGADIKLDGHRAVVRGVKKLSGAPLMATDLRASASLILAGLAAQGTTTVDRAYHIDRGYERIEEKLEGLGARIKRTRD
ncbi:MAG: UDP-N-acetylglucosamine 1-carboxyvinyltransferase, partial [Deltaproteobacteria bacterium]|nr:UDP-N-acetylglucosamine 1-carboxyvinyltransferase [Deltaproteobacteria bacterium]